MTLSFYLARRFLFSVLLVGAIFAGILTLFDMVEQIRRHSSNPAVGLVEVIQLSALNLPASLYEILPLVVMLGAIACFMTLARSSELVVIRAAGRSALRALVSPVITAVILGFLALVVLNPLIAAIAQRSEQFTRQLTQGQDAAVMTVSSEGIWLRQGDAEGQTVIHASTARQGGTLLEGVTYLAFDRSGQPVMRIEAAQARLLTGVWELTDLKRWPLQAENPERDAVREAQAHLPTDLSSTWIRESFSSPDAISIWKLRPFIKDLEKAGFNGQRHRVWLQRELALPLTLAAMVLLAAGFTMRHSRGGGTGKMVLLAILAGFGMFFLRNFAQVLGENGQISVALAAWAPPTVAIMAAIGLLLHLEDG